VLLDTRGDSVDDTISDNTMYGDHGLGIDLGGTGRPSALNGSPLFASIGPNDLLSYPSFVSVTTHDGQLRLLGSLESVLGGATYTIQVFSNDACNASGYGEGEHQIGTFTVSTTGVGRLTGEAEFDHTLPLNGAPATNVTATTTDSEGNTSEFAACVTGTASLKTNLKRRLKQGAQLLGTGVTNAAQADGTAGIAGGGGITVGGVAPDAGTYGAQVTAPGSGSVSHTLALPARARAVTVMAGSVHVRRAGVFTLKLRLTEAGRKLLRKAKRLTLTITARTAAGPSRAISSTRVNVRRHGPKA